MCDGMWSDDYIRKPYSLAILLAKVKRMLQRADSMAEEIVVGEVHLHIVQAQICYREQVLELSKNELKILYFLFRSRGEAVAKDALIEYLWENKFFVDENILNVNLSRLRKTPWRYRLKNTDSDGAKIRIPN